MKKTHQIELQQVGFYFALLVIIPGPRTTDYFSVMKKLTRALLIIDKYLVSYLPINKIKLKHMIHPDSSSDMIYIDEIINVDGSSGIAIKAYLRKCKELILSSLCSVTGRQGFEYLLAELTAEVDKIKQSLKGDYLSVDDNWVTTLPEIDLIRLLDKLWKTYKDIGNKIEISLKSLEDTPHVAFLGEPPLREWVDKDDGQSHPGLIKLTAVDFENSKKWKAHLINSGTKRSEPFEMFDPRFFEKIQSSQKNEHNGLLIGDVLKICYLINYDPIADKTAYQVTQVEDVIHADKMEQMPLYFS